MKAELKLPRLLLVSPWFLLIFLFYQGDEAFHHPALRQPKHRIPGFDLHYRLAAASPMSRALRRVATGVRGRSVSLNVG